MEFGTLRPGLNRCLELWDHSKLYHNKLGLSSLEEAVDSQKKWTTKSTTKHLKWPYNVMSLNSDYENTKVELTQTCKQEYASAG